jgi:hypothetical protein
VAVLGVAYELARHRTLPAEGAAKLADDPLGVLVEVDLLPDEGRSPAVAAAVAARLEGAHTSTEEEALELLHVAVGGPAHGRFFAATTWVPAHRRPAARKIVLGFWMSESRLCKNPDHNPQRQGRTRTALLCSARKLPDGQHPGELPRKGEARDGIAYFWHHRRLGVVSVQTMWVCPDSHRSGHAQRLPWMWGWGLREGISVQRRHQPPRSSRVQLARTRPDRGGQP